MEHRRASAPVDRARSRKQRIALAALLAFVIAIVGLVRALTTFAQPSESEAARPVMTSADFADDPVERDEVVLEVPERRELTYGLHALTGRLLDATGAPIAASEVEFTVQASEGRWWRWTARRSATTDESGRFALEMDYGETTTRVAVELRVGRWADATMAARADSDLVLGRESVDLGDLTPIEIPAILEGVVRSRRGAPLHRALVSARDSDYRGAGLLLATTDAGGRFELRGFVEGAHLELSAKCAGFLESPTSYVNVGEPDVAFALDPAGGVWGQVLTDASVPVEELTVTLRTMGAAAGRARFSTGVGYAGGFEFHELPSASYSLRIVARLSNDVLFETGDIVVDNGFDVSAERIHTIDLRGRLRGVQLFVRDALARRPVQGAWVFSSDGTRMVTRFAPTGSATILTAAEHLDIAVRANGYIVGALGDVHGATTIELERAPLITLTLPDSLELPPSGSGLTCSLQIVQTFDDGGASVGSGVLEAARGYRAAPSVFFGTQRRGTVAIEVPGTYRAFFVARGARDHRRETATALKSIAGAREIEVQRWSRALTYCVSPDVATYTDWCASVR